MGAHKCHVRLTDCQSREIIHRYLGTANCYYTIFVKAIYGSSLRIVYACDQQRARTNSAC